MSQPDGESVVDFSRKIFNDLILIDEPRPILNVRLEFKRYLRSIGVPELISDEFSETNLVNLVEKITKHIEEWINLGLERPVCFLDQQGTAVTWRHPKFLEMTGHAPINQTYCRVLKSIRSSDERRFLGYCACFLYGIGCRKVFITDTSGDGGIDVIGAFTSGHLRNVCIVVQAKTALLGKRLRRESLLGDYSKLLLLKKLPKWQEYCRALGVDGSFSGLSTIYSFLSNGEFSDSLIQAAEGLEVLLKSGRQIAAVLATLGNADAIEKAVDSLSPFFANTSRNLVDIISKDLR